VTRARCRGFTLIELIAIIVLVAMAATALLGLYANVSGTMDDNQDTQVAAQFAQECSEHVLAFRRSTAPGRGYTNLPIGPGVNLCNGFSGFSDFATPPATVDVVAHSAASLPACPSAAAGSCLLVTVRVDKAGDTLARNEFMLVQ
jgi:type II secretory pathway pseudopilin PulG